MKLDKQLNEDGEQSEIDAAAAAKVQDTARALRA